MRYVVSSSLLFSSILFENDKNFKCDKLPVCIFVTFMEIVKIIFAHPKRFTIYANDAVAFFPYSWPLNLLDYWQWSFTFINRMGKTVKTKHKTFCGSFFLFRLIYFSVIVFIFSFFFCLFVGFYDVHLLSTMCTKVQHNDNGCVSPSQKP